MTPKLADVKNVYGGQRFYPPGEHRASLKARTTLARLQELGFEDSPEAAHCEKLIAAVEVGEHYAKRHLLERLRRSSLAKL